MSKYKTSQVSTNYSKQSWLIFGNSLLIGRQNLAGPTGSGIGHAGNRDKGIGSHAPDVQTGPLTLPPGPQTTFPLFVPLIVNSLDKVLFMFVQVE